MMIVPNPVKKYTPEDLLSMPDGDHYELVDGQLVEHEMAFEACVIAGEVISRLRVADEDGKCGNVLPSEATYQCFPDAPNKVRKPDVSFIKAGRLPRGQIRGHIKIAPDVAVEVVSPNDNAYELDIKVEEYLHAGVPLVWVIWPETRNVFVHRADGSVSKLSSDMELTGEDVIPGFRCKVRELFAPLDRMKFAD